MRHLRKLFLTAGIVFALLSLSALIESARGFAESVSVAGR